MDIVLIDGDEVAYKAAFACETSVKWDDDTWVSFASEQEMRSSIDTIIEGAMHDTKTTKCLIALSDSKNFRKYIDPEYKLNRKAVRKPIGLKYCRGYLKEHYQARVINELEADDVLAIEACKNNKAVVWSVDKDFLTVPCNLYRKGKVLRTTKEQAIKNLMYQTIVGDKADNFAGAIGYGPVKAKKHLDKHGYNWEAVSTAFETKEECTKNARLARILWTPEEKLTWEPKYATT